MPLGLIIFLDLNWNSEQLEFHSGETKTKVNEFAGLESDGLDDLVGESMFAGPEEHSGN